MLYVTTRNHCDTFTAHKAFREARAADGGFYVPFQNTALSPGEGSINASIAEVLNLMFQTQLTAWDVDFSVGRYPVRLEYLRQRTIVAESWHNPDWAFERMVKNLSALIGAESAGDWLKIVVRIGVLTGIFGELKRSGIEEPVDIALVSGDFTGPISAWYARNWGLPIGNIICCCNENNSLWDLLCQGQLHTNASAVATCLPQADVVVPSNLERLIAACGGPEETEYFLECCRRGRLYCPEEAVLSQLRKGMYASVVSTARLDRTIRGAYDTHNYVLSPASALAYAGLLDYRAKSGNLRPALVLTEESPILSASFVADAIGVAEEELRKMI